MASALQTVCAAPGVSAQGAIATVARAYDYEAAFVDNKTVLFSKRYSNPQDLPEIGFDEASAFLNHLRDEKMRFLRRFLSLLTSSLRCCEMLHRNRKRPTQKACAGTPYPHPLKKSSPMRRRGAGLVRRLNPSRIWQTA